MPTYPAISTTYQQSVLNQGSTGLILGMNAQHLAPPTGDGCPGATSGTNEWTFAGISATQGLTSGLADGFDFYQNPFRGSLP